MKFINLPPLGPHGKGGGQIFFKNLVFSKSSSLLQQMWGEVEWVVIMSMKPSTKIMKFMATGFGVQVLRLGQYGHIVKIY